MNWLPFVVAVAPLASFCLWLWWTVARTENKIRKQEGMSDE